MLQIVGPDYTPEYQAATELADRIGYAWPDIQVSPTHHLTLVAAAKCYGQPVCDVDLVAFFQTTNPCELPPEPDESHPVFLTSFCLAIEVKDHPMERVRFVGSQVEVQYHERWHNVSEQNFKQRFSIKGYLEGQGVRSPFIVNLIWLRNVPEQHLPPPPHNILGQDTSWETMLQRFRQGTRPFWNKASKQMRIQAGGDIARSAEIFTHIRKPHITAIEEAKIKGVVQASAMKGEVPSYVAKLGTQLLVFQGRGGTGKTATLLKLAHVLYTYRQSRVLILTYNRALTADIRRLLSLMDVHDGVARQSITVQTVHSFLYSLMKGFGVLPDPCHDFLSQYDQYKMSLEMLLSAHEESINDLVQENTTAFSWDFVFVDEAQDWPADERNILFAVYDYRRFVIADGGDQLSRGYQRCHWFEHLSPAQRQIVSLRKSLRLKAGVCAFANAFAEQVGLTDWKVEPFGKEQGRILVLQANYANHRAFHDAVVHSHTEEKRSLIDMLFCVPPKLVRRDQKGTTFSVVARTLQEWGFQTWDATNPDITNQYPVDPNQVRIVQYDSCRGLEGWTVVHLGFDELYDYKVNTFEPTEEEQGSMLFDREKAAHEYAMRWLMIPLTRGMHTLVLQFSPTVKPDHPVIVAMTEIARKYPGLVEWQTTETPF